MAKTSITINGTEPKNLFPAFVLANAAIASGDDVIIYFTPDAAPALKKGVLENMKAKGMPDMSILVEGFRDMDGRIFLCELGLKANDLKEEDFMEGVEVVGASTFVTESDGAGLTFSF
jgi:predicted peroxiredoxin